MEAQLCSYIESPVKYKLARWLKGQCFALSLSEKGIKVEIKDGIERIRAEVTGEAGRVEKLKKLVEDRIAELKR